MSTRPALAGIHHLKLAVRDLAVAESFYARVLDAKRVPEADHRRPDGSLYAVIMEVPGLGTLLELRLSPVSAARQAGFDPITIGVADPDQLEAWTKHLDRLGVPHSGRLVGLRAWLVAFEDPDLHKLRLYTLQQHGDEVAPTAGDPWLSEEPVAVAPGREPDGGAAPSYAASDRPGLQGIDHVKLPVSDLDTALRWFARVFDGRHLSQFDHVDETGATYSSIVAVPGLDQPIELRWAPRAAASTAGYDPVSLRAGSAEQLAEWAGWLDRCGVPHSGVLHAAAGSLLVLADPDGTVIRLLEVPPGGLEAADVQGPLTEPPSAWTETALMGHPRPQQGPTRIRTAHGEDR